MNRNTWEIKMLTYLVLTKFKRPNSVRVGIVVSINVFPSSLYISLHVLH